MHKRWTHINWDKRTVRRHCRSLQELKNRISAHIFSSFSDIPPATPALRRHVLLKSDMQGQSKTFNFGYHS